MIEIKMELHSTEKIKELYGEFDRIYLEKVKPFIESNFPINKYSEPVYYILDNFILRRFRASLPYLMAKNLKVDPEKIIPLGAASELMFSIALVQDDFFDRCGKRGNLDSSHIKFNPRVAMASSDYSYAFCSKMINKIRNIGLNKETIEKVQDAFIDIQKVVFESFLMEMVNEKDFNFNMNDILTLHKSKTIHGTNTIYATALICDSINNTNIAEKIKKYCLDLAVAGQIKNDLYDLTRYSKTRGFSDLINGYMTYPLAKLKKVLNDEENENLKSLFAYGEAEKIVELIKREDIISLCIDDNEKYVNNSLGHINSLFEGRLKEIFEIWAQGNKINPDKVLLNG
tara:strand:- start:244 stop:1272 length:1029 start_codon:yes stop_codon:yes gene_type:complete